MANDDPMMASVAGRYASALFDLANEQRQLPQVEKDLVAFQSLLDQSEDLRRMVRSPVIPAEAQGKALTAILQHADIGGLTANFLRLIAKNRRLFATADMIKAFRQLAARQRGEVTAEVTSAHPLTQAQMQALVDQLRATIGGKQVVMTPKVDPAILGGLIVKMGSRMIDSSIRTKLNTLKTAMKGVR